MQRTAHTRCAHGTHERAARASQLHPALDRAFVCACTRAWPSERYVCTQRRSSPESWVKVFVIRRRVARVSCYPPHRNVHPDPAIPVTVSLTPTLTLALTLTLKAGRESSAAPRATATASPAPRLHPRPNLS